MNAPDAIEALREFERERWLRSTMFITQTDARAILDHITALTAERDAAVAEVGQIVAWLRKEAIMSTDTVRRRMNKALDQIETGAHKETTNDD
jgi:biopolymer transport protein ExbB/TolQ